MIVSKPDHQIIILSKLRVWFFPSKCYPELLTLAEVDLTRKNVCFDIPSRTLIFQSFFCASTIESAHYSKWGFFTTHLICSIKVPTAISVFVEVDCSKSIHSVDYLGVMRVWEEQGFFSICLLPRCMISFFSEVKNRWCKIGNSIRQFCGVRWVWDSTIHWLITCGVYFLTIPNYQGNTVSFDASSKSKIIFRVIHWLEFLPQGLYLMFFLVQQLVLRSTFLRFLRWNSNRLAPKFDQEDLIERFLNRFNKMLIILKNWRHYDFWIVAFIKNALSENIVFHSPLIALYSLTL